MLPRAAVIVTLLAAALAGVGDAQPDGPRIVSVYPNPTLPDDRGEYVVLAVPPGTPLGELRLADGETVAALPNRTLGGRVLVTTAPEAVRNATDLPVVGLRGRLALANAGETLELRRGGRVLDAVVYESAPEGEVYTRDSEGWRWRPLGATARRVAVAGPATARVFAFPDAAGEPVAALRAARERILLAGYTFASARVRRTLCGAHARGVTVRVLVEAGPVGGISTRSAAELDRLAACGVTVGVAGARRARYAYHHAKYAVIDDRALVLTENWKPSGTGGRANRGWGVLVSSPAVAGALAETFRADARWRGTVRWARFRTDRRFVDAGRADGRYPARFAPRRVPVDRVEVLLAPDNAEPVIADRLAAAERSIRVQQVSIGGPDHPFVRGLLEAARRGVRVRVLLSGAEYVRRDNRALVDRLNELSRTEGLPLRARVVEARSRFGQVHTKGVVIDRKQAIVGSINWNNHSLRENREVAVVLHGERVGRYYARVFRADWRGAVWRLPVGVLLGVVPALGLALRYGSRFVFAPDPDREPLPDRPEAPAGEAPAVRR